MTQSPRQRGRPKSFNASKDQNTIQSLARAIEVLEHLSAHGSQTLTEIATSMGQSPATIYRVLSTFEAKGLVEPEPASQTWAIGSGTFRIGSSFLRRTSVAARARPFMRQLMEATGETVNLGVQSGPEVLFLSQVETHEPIRAFIPPGTTSPLYASGIGKALLCFQPAADIQRLFPDETLVTFTGRTLARRDDLIEDLALSRSRGYALDDEERTEGMRCIAAPVFDIHGETVAGISVSGPSHRIAQDDIERIAVLVKEAASDLSFSTQPSQPEAYGSEQS